MNFETEKKRALIEAWVDAASITIFNEAQLPISDLSASTQDRSDTRILSDLISTYERGLIPFHHVRICTLFTCLRARVTATFRSAPLERKKIIIMELGHAHHLVWIQGKHETMMFNRISTISFDVFEKISAEVKHSVPCSPLKSITFQLTVC